MLELHNNLDRSRKVNQTIVTEIQGEKRGPGGEGGDHAHVTLHNVVPTNQSNNQSTLCQRQDNNQSTLCQRQDRCTVKIETFAGNIFPLGPQGMKK